jgi:hypothetical protein
VSNERACTKGTIQVFKIRKTFKNSVPYTYTSIHMPYMFRKPRKKITTEKNLEM